MAGLSVFRHNSLATKKASTLETWVPPLPVALGMTIILMLLISGVYVTLKFLLR